MARAGECTTRAITAVAATEEGIVIIRGLVELFHTHPPSQEQCKVEEMLTRVKKKTKNTLNDRQFNYFAMSWQMFCRCFEPPSRMKGCCTRRCNMPANLRTLEELEDIPDQYQRTLQGEQFLMFDRRQMK